MDNENKDLDNNMELCELLIEQIGKNLKGVFNKQAADNRYMNRDSFSSCYSRAFAAMFEAVRVPIDILALAIADENKENHDIDTSEEIDKLEKGMVKEQIAVSKRGHWKA